MNRLIGIVGVMGTGKTTLCAESGYEFIKTDVSGIYKKRGLDPKIPMSFDTRLSVQEEILEYHRELWVKACDRGSRVLVTDRTPLCFMTFTLCEISGYRNLTEAQDQALKSYIHRCWQTMTLFSGIMYLGQSFVTPVDPSGKIRASMSYGYREHHDNVLKGLVSDVPEGTPVEICKTADKNRRFDQLVKLVNRS